MARVVSTEVDGDGVNLEVQVFDKDRNDRAIVHVCDYFDSEGLTLLERWHVCHCIAVACEQVMGEGLKDVAKRVENIDFEALRAALG